MSEADNKTAEPIFECDLIMKGGVTSGIIYPAAIGAIARTYTIRSIGGTSAGAIAAAGAAAMEFGRRSKRNPVSLQTLSGLATKLMTPVDGQPMLLRLFEPDKSTARFFRLVFRIASSKSKVLGVLSALLLPGVLVPIAIAALACAGAKHYYGTELSTAWFTIVLGSVALILLSTLGYAGITLWFGLRAMSANGFGLCSGNAQYRQKRKNPFLFWRKRELTTSLTGWLHAQYQELAGLEPKQVLTFGDLWVATKFGKDTTREQALAQAYAEAKLPAPEVGEKPCHEAMPRDIELSLVASDINRAQSVQLPFMRREDRLFARLSDLKELFPSEVVDWMEANQRTDNGRYDLITKCVRDEAGRTDFIGLPLPENLPVLFAVRMSLSFPFLFRAVPIYVARRQDDGNMALKELLLADGGLTSNFPIHLFDAPIPTRPTFCINLLYHDDQLLPDDDAGKLLDNPDAQAPDQRGLGSRVDANASERELVYMLRSNRGRLSPYTEFDEKSPVARLGRYAMRLVTTARQWGDNQLIDVPGYRDRIVHIKMQEGEGGFNLAMSKETVEKLERRGQLAGDVIAHRFHPRTNEDPLNPGELLQLNWTNHRFVRFRSFLAGLEIASSRFRDGWKKDGEQGELPGSDPAQAYPSLEAICEEGVWPSTKQPYVGYKFKAEEQAELALKTVDAFQSVRVAADPTIRGLDYWYGESSSPRPKGLVRLRPPLETDTRTEKP